MVFSYSAIRLCFSREFSPLWKVSSSYRNQGVVQISVRFYWQASPAAVPQGLQLVVLAQIPSLGRVRACGRAWHSRPSEVWAQLQHHSELAFPSQARIGVWGLIHYERPGPRRILSNFELPCARPQDLLHHSHPSIPFSRSSIVVWLLPSHVYDLPQLLIAPRLLWSASHWAVGLLQRDDPVVDLAIQFVLCMALQKVMQKV